MSPEHKAKELFLKFRHQNLSTWINDSDAKKITLIAVDEIINFHKHPNQSLWKKYWEKVKRDITKL